MYVVEVNEVKVNATRAAANWWAMYTVRFRGTGRITEVTSTLGGAVCHVACDDQDHAAQLVEHMVAMGMPATAVKVKRLSRAA